MAMEPQARLVGEDGTEMRLRCTKRTAVEKETTLLEPPGKKIGMAVL